MTDLERMGAGQLYHPGDEALAKARMRARVLCRRYNTTDPEDFQGRDAILRELLGSVGKDAYIEPSLCCDYGTQIHLGDFFYANFDCVFLDAGTITFGSRVYVAPRVCFYTVNHPMVPEIRNTDLEYARPITVGDNVWIGGNAVILPGVTIGSGSVLAAGAVVNQDIPENVLAGGNPCRVLRPLTEKDHAKWEAARREYEAVCSYGRKG
ncbi:MAG: sugar O-acetyltransferase [Oscillibacter sp.]|nr:sugar O-acetyltransferase [Oscillibacter sp.]